MNDAVRRLREFIVHRVLHLDDTPERIALGVALGFFVAWTPTLGLQMMIYLLLATLARANKISGLGPVWITNPLTAIPIYYSNWWVGQFMLRDAGDDRSAAEVKAALRAVEEVGGDLTRLFQAEFWKEMGAALRALGVELWFGSIAVGIVLGVASYFLALRAIVAYRKRKAEHGHSVRTTPSVTD